MSEGRRCARCERGYVMRGRPREEVLCTWCWEAWAASRDCHNCGHGVLSDRPDEGRELDGLTYLCGIWKAIQCQPGRASACWIRSRN
jgi:hypothetical protein